MPLFRDKSWDISRVPKIDLDSGTRIDIGFLGGDEHRDAFAALFAKMLRDNPEVSEARLERIDTKKSVALTEFLHKRFADIDVASLAMRLYDSGNERVLLRIGGHAPETTIGVGFDDPEFWSEPPAA